MARAQRGTLSSAIRVALGAAAINLAMAAPVWADFIALESTRTTGNQTWTGALGMDFDVLAPIIVTEVGAYDSGRDGFASNLGIQVGIFDRTTQTLVVGSSATLSTGNTAPTASGLNRFFNIPDLTLGIGQYSIVAVGFGSSDPNGNTGFGGTGPTIDTGGGLISLVGLSRYTSITSLVFPTTVDAGPSNRYDAGTFRFISAEDGTVPEPGTLALLGLGLAGLAATRRRKQ